MEGKAQVQDDSLEGRLAAMREAQGAVTFRFLQLRFVAAYLLLGALLAGILAADYYAVTNWNAPRRIAAVERAVKATPKAAEQAAITAAEVGIAKSIAANGGVLLGFDKATATIKGTKATVTLRVRFNDPTGKTLNIGAKITEAQSGGWVVSNVVASK